MLCSLICFIISAVVEIRFSEGFSEIFVILRLLVVLLKPDLTFSKLVIIVEMSLYAWIKSFKVSVIDLFNSAYEFISSASSSGSDEEISMP